MIRLINVVNIVDETNVISDPRTLITGPVWHVCRKKIDI